MGVNIEDFPKLSMHNMKAIEEAKWCSCYFCFEVFKAELIDLCVDDGGESYTAFCPHCDMDALVPGQVDKETLVAACERWFGAKYEI